MEAKICTKCKILKWDDEFTIRFQPNILCSWCKECNNFAGKEWKKRNPDNTWKNHIKTFYGLSKENYLNLLKLQNNKCKICNKEDVKILSVDHCHKTGKIRGLLCRKCNSAIGLFYENIINLQNAINYLQEVN